MGGEVHSRSFNDSRGIVVINGISITSIVASSHRRRRRRRRRQHLYNHHRRHTRAGAPSPHSTHAPHTHTPHTRRGAIASSILLGYPLTFEGFRSSVLELFRAPAASQQVSLPPAAPSPQGTPSSPPLQETYIFSSPPPHRVAHCGRGTQVAPRQGITGRRRSTAGSGGVRRRAASQRAEFGADGYGTVVCVAGGGGGVRVRVRLWGMGGLGGGGWVDVYVWGLRCGT
jgi:hypothetical protein